MPRSCRGNGTKTVSKLDDVIEFTAMFRLLIMPPLSARCDPDAVRDMPGGAGGTLTGAPTPRPFPRRAPVAEARLPRRAILMIRKDIGPLAARDHRLFDLKMKSLLDTISATIALFLDAGDAQLTIDRFH